MNTGMTNITNNYELHYSNGWPGIQVYTLRGVQVLLQNLNSSMIYWCKNQGSKCTIRVMECELFQILFLKNVDSSKDWEQLS